MWVFGRSTPSSRRTSSFNNSSTNRKGKRAQSPVDEFVETWQEFRACLNSNEPVELSTSRVPSLLGNLLALLLVEKSSPSNDREIGPCLEYVLKNAVLATLVKLSLRDEPPSLRKTVIEWFDEAILGLDESFLTHVAVHSSIVTLLQACIDEQGGLHRGEEEPVVSLMNTICQRIAQRPDLLSVFLRDKPPTSQHHHKSVTIDDTRPASPSLSQSTFTSSLASPPLESTTGSSRIRLERDFVIFSYLLRYVHREGTLGTHARSGLLAIAKLALSRQSPAGRSAMPRSESARTITTPHSDVDHSDAIIGLAEFLLDSDFAEVVGAGLGALYGLLPSRLLVRLPQDAATSLEPLEDGTPSQESQALLGGMGAVGEAVDPDELQERRDEEAKQLRLLGLVTSDSPEYTYALACWLALFSFAQEVVDSAAIPDEHADEPDSESHHHASLVRAIVETVLSAVQSLLLKNVVYPSLLECAEGDGSAVAVLTYLTHLFEVLREGTLLEARIFRFMLGDQEQPDETAREDAKKHKQPRRAVKRKKSSSLKLLETAIRTAKMSTSAYFTEVDRFGLKDLVLTHINCTSSTTMMAALKLFDVLLRRHDRWSLLFLDAQGLLSSAVERPESDFERPWDSLLALHSIIDPSCKRGGVIQDTTNEPYLRQAEHQIVLHRSFLREVSQFELRDEPVEPSSRRKSAGPSSRKIRLHDIVGIHLGMPHQVAADSKAMTSLLDRLSRWFAQTPFLNLALTAVITDLLLDQFRSLDGWFVGANDMTRKTEPDLSDFESPRHDDGDDRSDDYVFEELARRQAAMPGATASRSTHAPRPGSDSVVPILAALAGSVESYRRQYDDFDQLLAERRKSLVFVDDLADALDTHAREVPATPAQQQPSTPIKTSRRTSYASFLSPKSAAQPRPAYPSTPPPSRAVHLRKDTTMSRDVASDNPFAKHYKETGGIRVSPVLVDSPLRRASRSSQSHSPSPAASPLPGAAHDNESNDAKSETTSITSRTNKEVTLSVVLDNVIVLEEFIKELAAVLYVRRSLFK